MYYVYLLKSVKFDQTYIGSTKDLKRRLKEHNSGLSFSTKPFLPWTLVYYEAFADEKSARYREKNLKYNGNAVRELKKRVFLSKSGAGYTLVEILVALTVIGLLFSLGFVSFRDFSRRQALLDAAKAIQGDLRLAQGDAITGQRPSNCSTTLDSYSFNVRSSTRYTIEANCAVTPPIVKDVTLTSDITISTPLPNPLKFKILGQGTNITVSDWVLTLTQMGTGNTTSVTVTSGGEIK